ncbi:hypothetical protein HYPSUDRAFT_44375 [Hypholoma sublateritium FD-334 SS-4]|uniref:Uncharacterized protein n=1 Tax=Hypholoma sublateritium (strain FD-334 SS-4) TaxID=945553 RepID=A0A0D2NRJ8_HYPSF|nr:hypothetical protein HYPSUDRAFT_44375 [Hypholoma sublateritium FD-334 SS-4]
MPLTGLIARYAILTLTPAFFDAFQRAAQRTRVSASTSLFQVILKNFVSLDTLYLCTVHPTARLPVHRTPVIVSLSSAALCRYK